MAFPNICVQVSANWSHHTLMGRLLSVSKLITLQFDGQVVLGQQTDPTTLWWAGCQVSPNWFKHTLMGRLSSVSKLIPLHFDGQVIKAQQTGSTTLWWAGSQVSANWTHHILMGRFQYSLMVRLSRVLIPPQFDGQVIKYQQTDPTALWWAGYQGSANWFHHTLMGR